jgi:hypothetical protein
MTIDIVCPSCGRLLRIAAEHAGKQIRCPACQQVSISPAEASAGSGKVDSQAMAAAEDATLWHVRTPEGAVYGPIRWDVVLSWAEEGRVADDCELAKAADGPWQPAGSLIPGLGSSVLSSGADVASPSHHGRHSSPYMTGGSKVEGPMLNVEPQQPFAGGWSPAVAAGGGYAGPGGSYVAPHRGPLVLVMGILGFFVGCPVFSAIAWILGSRDLREMRAGRMDRSGESVTLVGMILGMVLSILWLAATFILLTIFLVAVGMNL